METGRHIKNTVESNIETAVMENSKEETSHPKLPRLKIFLAIHKNLASLGIAPMNSTTRFPNAKISIDLLTLGLSTICASMYILIEAKTFLEFTQSIYLFSGTILVALIFLVVLFNLSEMFEIIDDCECLVNTSE